MQRRTGRGRCGVRHAAYLAGGRRAPDEPHGVLEVAHRPPPSRSTEPPDLPEIIARRSLNSMLDATSADIVRNTDFGLRRGSRMGGHAAPFREPVQWRERLAEVVTHR